MSSDRLRRSRGDRFNPPYVRRSSRRVPVFWTRRGDAATTDRLAVRDYIESRADAARYRDLNIRAMRSTASLSALVRSISKCSDTEPCGKMLCPFCARQYRFWLASELHHLFCVGLPAFAATILLTVVPGPDLYCIDVKSLQECTRKRLLRAGFEGAVGGFAAFNFHEDRWVVHIHLLLLGEIQEAKPRLRNAFPEIGLGRPVVCRPLDNRIKQITYVQKFHTYHRPGAPGFSGRGRAYPLKARQVVQLANWTEDRKFEDFLFLLGARRRGSRFVVEGGFEIAVRKLRRAKAGGDGGDGGDGRTATCETHLHRRRH
jgi:hypothetical protein